MTEENYIGEMQEFIEEHIVEDEIDGIERTLVSFNYNDWIRFKRKLKNKK